MSIRRGIPKRLLILYALGFVAACFILTSKRLVKKKEKHEIVADELRRVEILLEEEETKRKKISNLCSELENTNHYETVSHLCSSYPLQMKPLIYHKLSYLNMNSIHIRPDVILSSNRTGVWMVMGISTVRRDKNFYILNTVGSLIDNLSEEDRSQCLIVILITEISDRKSFVEEVSSRFKEFFQEHLDSGLLEVAVVPVGFYPDFDTLTPTFNDSLSRARWRTKQNLDYVYLMMYCINRGTYYLQLEDDIATSPDYATKIRDHYSKLPANDWFVLEFSGLGFIGKFFHKKSLATMVQFLILFYDDKPCDWLLHHVLEMYHSCTSLEECKLHRKFIKPSLFQHVGTYSSLPGKIQKIKAPDFVGQISFVKKSRKANPGAKVDTSLKKYSSFSLQTIYDYESPDEGFYYWSYNPKADDYLMVIFSQPICISRYLIRSGMEEHPSDIFYDVVLEVKPKDPREQIESESGFIQIGAINSTIESETNEKGIFVGDLNEKFGNIEAIGIRFLSDSPYWLVISEITITTCYSPGDEKQEKQNTTIEAS